MQYAANAFCSFTTDSKNDIPMLKRLEGYIVFEGLQPTLPHFMIIHLINHTFSTLLLVSMRLDLVNAHFDSLII
jgi:hypothetical protein